MKLDLLRAVVTRRSGSGQHHLPTTSPTHPQYRSNRLHSQPLSLLQVLTEEVANTNVHISMGMAVDKVPSIPTYSFRSPFHSCNSAATTCSPSPCPLSNRLHVHLPW